jgi:hypothetical protein
MNSDSPAGTSKSPRWRSRLAMLVAAAAAVIGLAAFPALTANASPAPARTVLARTVLARTGVVTTKAKPDLAGAYTLHFSWGCTAAYAQAGLTFNANGTFTDAFGGAGTWAQVNGSVFWEYNAPGRTVYSGTIDGNVGSGASSTFAGANGCWYLVAAGTTGIVTHVAPHGLTPAGNDR